MSKAEFLILIEELFELDAGTLSGREMLNDLDGWNSMARISFLALLDEHAGVSASARELNACRTVNDLFALAA